MAEAADRLIVLALSQVAFLGKCDDQGLGPWSWPFSCLQTVVSAVITAAPPVWTSSAGMLSTPAGFPFSNYRIAVSTCLRRMEWSFSVSVWGQFSPDGSPLNL